MNAKLTAPFCSGNMKRRPSLVATLINNAIALTIVTCLSACTSSEPYRTNLAGCDTTDCPDQNLDRWCKQYNPAEKIQDCIEQHTTPEKNDKYTLHFVEFDDQGWLPQQDGKELKDAGNASKQLDFMMRSLYEQARLAKNGVSVVVYVHGWHHNAQFDDSNVKAFRQLLADSRDQESKKPDGGKDIVGVYVGWRGESIDLPYFKYLTFWDRKSTAIHVAEGSTRELFARIHEFQKRTNKARQSENKYFVRTLFIGHSFGAQVVYFSISDQLIASIAGTKDQIDAEKRRIALSRQLPDKFRLEDESKRFREMERPADMVLLINPAFEAARFEPLQRALLKAANCGAGGCEFQSYIPPLLVIVTSDADTATKNAFPTGRFINSIFERPFTSDEQSLAVTRTPGFMDGQYSYVTHRLDLQSKSNPVNPTDPACSVSRNNEEFTRNNHYFDGTKWQDGKSSEGWMRNFCGADKTAEGTTLIHNKGLDPNSPIWNVRTTKDIIEDHNDIAKPVFKSFVLQLYHDLVLFDQSEK